MRWDEIIRIAQTQVVVKAEMDMEDGQRVSVRQSTDGEEKLAKISSLLEINMNPIGKVKSVVPLKSDQKNRILRIKDLRSQYLQCELIKAKIRQCFRLLPNFCES